MAEGLGAQKLVCYSDSAASVIVLVSVDYEEYNLVVGSLTPIKVLIFSHVLVLSDRQRKHLLTQFTFLLRTYSAYLHQCEWLIGGLLAKPHGDSGRVMKLDLSSRTSEDICNNGCLAPSVSATD